MGTVPAFAKTARTHLAKVGVSNVIVGESTSTHDHVVATKFGNLFDLVVVAVAAVVVTNVGQIGIIRTSIVALDSHIGFFDGLLLGTDGNVSSSGRY